MTLEDKSRALSSALAGVRLENEVMAAFTAVRQCLDSGHTVFACGNGGSYADAAHFVAELVGKLSKNRGPKSAILLGSNESAASAISNDFGFHEVFSRELRGLARTGDLLICFSTSGHSANVVEAASLASQLEVPVIAITGLGPNPLTKVSNVQISVNSTNTQTLQECHGVILHYICELLDQHWFGESDEHG